jgi:type I restriction enzyme S subunit
MSGSDKRVLAPRLRFPEFREARAWESAQLDQLISTITPSKKIPTTEYLLVGKFPIIDQGQNVVAGWTNDSASLIETAEPLLVFGDHTCVLKLVRQPFAQGADGIKIIMAGKLVAIDYLYQFLCFSPVIPEEYKRHFSILKKRWIAYPKREGGEQQKIADCLSSLDELIAVETQKLDALRGYKKGLMQQLFPREGETVPRLRFPEFLEEWQRRKVSGLLTRSVNPVNVEIKESYQEIGIRSHGKGIFHKKPVRGETLGNKRVFWVEYNTFVVNIVFAWEQAVAVTSSAEKGMIASHRFPMYKAKDGKSDVNFVKYFFLTKKGKELLGMASPGGAGRNKTLGQKEFENLEFFSPLKIEEQNKVAHFLSSIDDLITAQGQKVDAFKTHKKCLMQQLFPVMDETQP